MLNSVLSSSLGTEVKPGLYLAWLWNLIGSQLEVITALPLNDRTDFHFVADKSISLHTWHISKPHPKLLTLVVNTNLKALLGT